MNKVIKKLLKQFYIINYVNNKVKIGIDHTRFFRENRYRKILNNLNTKDTINIIFMINDISQWKSSVLYKLFAESKKYSPIIIISSDCSYNKDIDGSMKNIYKYFKDNGYNVLNAYDKINKKWIDLNKIYKPDIVFFSRVVDKKESIYGIDYFKQSLICYIPYSFFTDKNTFLQVGTSFHRKLWKYFVPTKLNKDMAQQEYDAKNIVVTNGYPGCDLFLSDKEDHVNPWINDNKKKVIWAPHHTIEKVDDAPYFSTFLLYYSVILELSQKYKNEIQICFKPHPGLKNKLYCHKEWGKEKTDLYYNKWNKYTNTFLADGAYQDLFIYSDTMILDSVSFLAEYLYLNKPYCFLTRADKGDYSKFLNEVGLSIFPVVYKASNPNELNSFFLNQVIYENDTLKLRRADVIKKDLKIDIEASASKKIFDEINQSISQ